LCLHDSLSSMGALIADVVILSNIPKVLSYSIPNDVSPKVGLRVAAPVRKSTRVGVIIGIRESSESDEGLKDLACALDEIPFIAPELIELISWTSKYYHAGIGPCMALAFPPYLRQCRTIILDEDPVIFRTDRENDRLGPHQKSILDAIPNTGIRMSTLKDLLPGITQKIKALAKRGFIELKEVPCSSALPVLRHRNIPRTSTRQSVRSRKPSRPGDFTPMSSMGLRDQARQRCTLRLQWKPSSLGSPCSTSSLK